MSNYIQNLELQSLEEEFLPLPTKNVSIAESQSRIPQTPRLGHLSAGTPMNGFQAIAATQAVLEEAGEEYWLSEDWIRKMAHRCYCQQYEGEWATLQVLLQSSLNAKEYEDNIKELLTPRSYYGNYLPSVRRFRKTVKLQSENQFQRKVLHRESRRRGYRDKGSRVPDWIRGRLEIPPKRSDVPKLDFRDKIIHPLLTSTKANLLGRGPPEHVSTQLEWLRSQVDKRKELISYEHSLKEQNPPWGREFEGDPETEEAQTRSKEKPPEKPG